MLNLFILASRVVRFSPSFHAAPRGPPTIQPACSSVSKIKERSESSKVIAAGKVRVRCRLGIMSSVGLFRSGFGSTPSRERITARSTKFCNSRMFPGHEYHWKAAMVSGGMQSTCLPMRRLNILTKCLTSAGMSSLRSLNAGSKMGNTFSR